MCCVLKRVCLFSVLGLKRSVVRKVERVGESEEGSESNQTAFLLEAPK